MRSQSIKLTELAQPMTPILCEKPPQARSLRASLPFALVLAFAMFFCGISRADVPNTWYTDASINDIQFVDESTGIAVGDHGVVWRTNDGGLHWNQIPSGTESHLQDVHFVDRQYGWAVGTQFRPYASDSTGTILKTRDGGATWQVLPDQSLPGLNGVQFIDSRQGWAVGDPSALFPSGLFESDDGGLSWRSLPGTESATFRKFAVLPARELLVVGQQGKIALADRGGIKKATINLGQWQTLSDIAAVNQKAIAVGEGGLLVRSEDAGTSWEPILPSSLARSSRDVDFLTVERLGNHIWVAGNPGSFVLHSSDGGNSWERQLTGITAPIRAFYFLNEQAGWAAGSLGTILHTTDGGQTWHVQKSGGDRLALLTILDDAESVPFELVAQHAGSEGYLTGIEIVNRSLSDTHFRETMHQAILSCGGSQGHVCWRFPSDPKDLELKGEKLLRQWNTLNDAQGLDAAQRQMVQWIRQWKPSIVLTTNADPNGQDPMAYLTNQLVIRAVDQAANPEAFPEQLSELGLAPWSVVRSVTLMPEDDHGSITLNTTQLSAQLACTLAERGTISRGVLFGEMRPSPDQIEMNVIQSNQFVESRITQIFEGLSIPHEEGARRPRQKMPIVDLKSIQKLAQKRRNLLQMTNQAAQSGSQGTLALGQMLVLAQELPDERSVEVLFHVAAKAEQEGNFALAEEFHRQIVSDFPQHALAEKSAHWLVTRMASAEYAYLRGKPVEFSESKIARVSFDDPSEYQQPVDAAEKGSQLVSLLTQSMPHVLSKPQFAFSLERLLSENGQSRKGESYLRRLLNLSPDDPWNQKAQWELSLGHGQVRQDAPVQQAKPSASKPLLDGKLDDVIWQTSQPFDLSRGSDVSPAALVMAYDEEFLYLAIRSRKAQDFVYQADMDPLREHDEDLSKSDSLQIFLDLDRDYQTFFEFRVDYLGRTAETFGTTKRWNPRWFVAARQDDVSWTVEAAIPLKALSADGVEPGSTWALGVQRVVSGSGAQSWPATATYPIQPQQFGLLRF